MSWQGGGDDEEYKEKEENIREVVATGGQMRTRTKLANVHIDDRACTIEISKSVNFTSITINASVMYP